VIGRAWRAAGVAILVAAPLPAQVGVRISLGLRYSSDLVRDSIVTPFDVRPALAPAASVALALPLEKGWTALATLDGSRSTLHRVDATGSVALQQLTTLAFTVGFERPIIPRLSGEVGLGGVRYSPSAETGVFKDGNPSIAGLVLVQVNYAPPLPGPFRRCALSLRYDLHQFITTALRAEGFQDSRAVHRFTLGVTAALGAAP